MCIALFTLEHPEYALVLCSNRDEHLARPTRPAAFHADVLSGIDAQAGGTWLGLSRQGRLALLTNITEPDAPAAPSRGHLVPAFLAAPPDHDPRTLVPPDATYAGFNLLCLAPRPTPSFDALYVTNRGAGGPISSHALPEAQRHRGGLSNGIDGAGADTWPKLQHGIRALDALLATLAPNTSDDHLAERLFDLLTWRSSQPPRDRSELRNTIEVEPIVLAGGLYATRLSTVVLVKRTGDVLFIERDRWRLTQDGPPVLADPSSQRVFRFNIPQWHQQSSADQT